MDIIRRSELAGAAAASRDNVEDASGGSCTFAGSFRAASFSRFRRLCGGSAIESLEDSAVVEMDWWASLAPSLASDTFDNVLGVSSLPCDRNAFAQKNLLSTSSSFAVATCLAPTALEKARLAGSCWRASRLAHRKHIVLASSVVGRLACSKRRGIGKAIELVDAVEVEREFKTKYTSASSEMLGLARQITSTST